jgi:hypothetical protein
MNFVVVFLNIKPHFMKKFTLLALFAFVCMGCGDDDDTVISADINGTWLLTSISLDPSQAFDANQDGVISDNYLDETDCFNGSTITFGANNTAVFSMNCFSVTDSPETATYIVAPSSVSFIYNPVAYPGYNLEATYIRYGNTLTASFNYADDLYVPGLEITAIQTVNFLMPLLYILNSRLPVTLIC